MKLRYIVYGLGFSCIFAMSLMFTLTFIGAFFSPTHSAIVSIGIFSEAWVELVIICLASPCMIWCFFLTFQRILPNIRRGEL